jgi:type III secretory pathway component EscV
MIHREFNTALTVELDPTLISDLNSQGSALEVTLKGRLAELIATLGIPGQVTVTISALKETLPAGRFLRLFVNGQVCRHPDELIRWVYSYMNGVHIEPGEDPTAILARLCNGLTNKSEPNRSYQDGSVEFLTLTCLEIIKTQPAVLLGLPQVEAYTASLPEPTNGSYAARRLPNLASLLPILRAVLDLRISIADQQTVANVLWEARDKSPAHVSEDLIAALRPEVIEIQLELEYLREITTFDPENKGELFPFLRDGLFVELGITYPPFRFVPVENLRPSSFRFKIGHLSTLPMSGLRSDQCLVNDTSDRLRLMNIEAHPTTNPANGQPNSLIDLRFQPQVEEAGLTTWNQIQYLILSFAAVLRKNSACFINCVVVQRQLDQLEQAFPALVKAATATFSLEQITRILRGLIEEEISIRNLRLILERLLDYEESSREVSSTIAINRKATEDFRNAGWGEQTADVIAFLRAGMKRQLKHKYSRGTDTIVVYLLDPKIEQTFSERPLLEADGKLKKSLDEDKKKILTAFRDEVTHLPLTAQMPVLLTIPEARPALREIIASEFPRVSVISYDDLPPDVNIQPVARISLND